MVKDNLVYIYIRGLYAYVGRTNDINERHTVHLRENIFFKGADRKIYAKNLSLETAKVVESLCYMNLVKSGFTMVNKVFPNHQALERNASKLPTCPICIELGCTLSDEEVEELVNRKVQCSVCGKIHKPTRCKIDGELVCLECYLANKYGDEVECSICGKIEKPSGLTDGNGNPVCNSCHKDIKAQKQGFVDRLDPLYTRAPKDFKSNKEYTDYLARRNGYKDSIEERDYLPYRSGFCSPGDYYNMYLLKTSHVKYYNLCNYLLNNFSTDYDNFYNINNKFLRGIYRLFKGPRISFDYWGIVEALLCAVPYDDICDIFVVSKGTVSEVNNGGKYFHPLLDYPLSSNLWPDAAEKSRLVWKNRSESVMDELRGLTSVEAREVKEALKHPYKGLQVILSEKYGVSPATISAINNGRTYIND